MAAFTTIGKIFPEPHWCMWTLMALLLAVDAVAGVYSRHFSISRAIGTNCTNYDGEVHLAPTEVSKIEDQNSVIFMDSQGHN